MQNEQLEIVLTAHCIVLNLVKIRVTLNIVFNLVEIGIMFIIEFNLLEIGLTLHIGSSY